MAAAERKIIVGIDYGTTKTCVAYALWDPNNPARTGATTMDWNGNPSTPSKLAYGQNERVFWGRDAETVVPGYTWSKVLLDPEQHHDGHQTGVLSSLVRNGVLRLGPPRKQERVIVDFLGALRIQISTALENTYQTLPPVEWRFSIPAVWDQQPRQRMITVITEAGYLSDPLHSVFLITEAEAAAISTFHRAPNLQFYQEFRFLVCDCGGGTSDITAMSVQNRVSGLQYTQIAASTGMRIGGAEVDCKLLELLEAEHRAQGTTFADMMADPLNVANVMGSIEQVKVNFSGCEQRILDLPTGQVVLSPEKIKQALDPVVEQIIILVIRTINAATKYHQPLNLDRVLLEGGFGQSPYLRARLKQRLDGLCPLEEHNQYWAPSVAYGATLSGLEAARRVSALCTRHFGLQSVCVPPVGTIGGVTQHVPCWILKRVCTYHPLNILVDPQLTQPQNERLQEGRHGSVDITLTHQENDSLAKGIMVIAAERCDMPPEVIGQPIIAMGMIPCHLNQVTLANAGQFPIDGRVHYFPTVTVHWNIASLNDGRKEVNFNVTAFGRALGNDSVIVPS
ncbi:Hsp70 family protein [Aspergillus puulaauensis]|uniref:Actin-like ATPase domain-containing protein n=1 Tax=Aspergillus puulaauensis TaxID=1220207 RepID=A0A7R7XA87_9EURO|nr:uncharacterized protein APUU_10383S [Aspergillus puulaauensis]BCS17555.1 hypothetical protein APUU_10383S [Aspergillus puulaauensis]